MLRSIYLVVAALCYFAFFAAFVYLVGFIAGWPGLPTHVDKGLAAPPATAALIDLGLIALFGLQHSVMARKGFKQRWTTIVPAGAERSVYCLASALALGAMFAFWHPIENVVWEVTEPNARMLLWGLFMLGFAIVFVSTWLINHFELFGLAQAWHAMRGQTPPTPRFQTPLFYRAVRHPIYTGFTIALWATPFMTLGHLLLATGLTIYMLIAIRFEERDLVGSFGSEYEAYRMRVSMLVPMPGRR